MARSPEPPRYYAAAGYHRASPSSSVAASCVVAALFILLAAGGAAAVLFLLYRPQAPAIAVTAVQLPSFASRNGSVAFTFQQLASVRNPNRSPLAHYDSSLRVAYAGGEVGSMYIPAGQIDGGRTQYMATSFTVPAFAVTSSAAASSSPAQTITVPASGPSPAAVGAVALQQEQQPQQQLAAPPVMEVDSLLVVKGKVTILRVFTHHVVAAKVCRIGVSPADGRVLGFRNRRGEWLMHCWSLTWVITTLAIASTMEHVCTCDATNRFSSSFWQSYQMITLVHATLDIGEQGLQCGGERVRLPRHREQNNKSHPPAHVCCPPLGSVVTGKRTYIFAVPVRLRDYSNEYCYYVCNLFL